MVKIKFSYIFNDDLERVYEGFKEISDKIIVKYQNLISNIKFHKGNDFDEINAEFSLCWKNYYQIKLIVDNVTKAPSFRSIVQKTLSIDKLPIQITFTYNFYWDSINKKTIFMIELEYQEEFFIDLIKNDFNDEDKMNICKIIESYLSISLKGLDYGYSCTKCTDGPSKEIYSIS